MYGLIHIYCGEGKGKTTAAMGLAVRCAGQNGTVLVVQFMKQDTSGERKALHMLPGVHLWETYPSAKFSFQMTDAEKNAAAAWYQTMFQQLAEAVETGSVQMLILDEVFSCISCGFLPESALLAFLEHRPPHLEVVMTGRNPGAVFVERADYVTEMVCRKHPYQKGIAARRGVEY